MLYFTQHAFRNRWLRCGMEWGDGMHDKGDAEKYLHPFALARLQHNLNGGNV